MENKKTIIIAIAVLAVIGLGVGGYFVIKSGLNKNNNEQDEVAALENVTKVVYKYIDASVPPQYNRNYTITVTTTHSSVIVDSYGDLIAQQEYTVTQENFNDIISSLVDNEIDKGEDREASGCTGGNGAEIEYYEGDNEVFSAYRYSCANTNYGDLTGDVDEFATDMQALVPDLDSLLAR
jgi:hypothetical protein